MSVCQSYVAIAQCHLLRERRVLRTQAYLLFNQQLRQIRDRSETAPSQIHSTMLLNTSLLPFHIGSHCRYFELGFDHCELSGLNSHVSLHCAVVHANRWEFFQIMQSTAAPHVQVQS